MKIHAIFLRIFYTIFKNDKIKPIFFAKIRFQRFHTFWQKNNFLKM